MQRFGRRRAGALLGLALVLAGSRLAGGAAVEAETRPDRPPGSITFVGRNLFATANGTFRRWRIARADLDRDRPENSVVEVEVDVASLDTGNDRRDRHLRTEDFFEVERHPVARVRARDPRAAGTSDSGRPLYRVQLDLEIHGVQKTVEAMVEITESDPLAVEGSVVLDRNDFGVGDPHQRFNPLSIRDEIPVRFTATLEDEGAAGR